MTPSQEGPTAAPAGGPSSVTGLGHRKGIVIASLNVNSLMLHIDEIRLLINDLGIHILAINETKIDENVHDDLVSIDGYMIERCDRNRNGGGVAIYIKDTLFDKCTVRVDVPKSTLEALCIEVKPVRSAPFFVLAWYRPPSEAFGNFRLLEECLQFLDKEDKEIILLGDTNCDLLPKSFETEHSCSNTNLLPHSKRLTEIYQLFGFHQLIKAATRETLISSTLIDHIATTNKSNIVVSGVHQTSISDHYLVYSVRKFRGGVKKQHKNISSRQMKNFSESQFLDDLQKVDWKGIVSHTVDVNIIVEQWTTMFSLVLEKHAPLRNRRVSERFCPWLTKEFKLMCASRDKLRKQAIRSKSDILFDAYKQLRNNVNKVNIDLKRDYFTNKIASHEGDMKSTWKTINLVLNKKSKTTQITSLDVDGENISKHEAIAEHMNTYFCNIGQDLSDKIPSTQNPLLEGKYSINPEATRFHFQPVNSHQLASVLGKFKTSMGFGTDCIANHFLKIGLPIISDSLCDIFNLSIATGVFPDCWKIARVAPIFKSGQTEDRSNYRPISVLPVLSRIFEKIIFNQLYEYLDINKHLFSKQSGFRRLYSVVTSLLACTNDWYRNMDTGKYTALVFIDLKKAFDTVIMISC